MKNKFTFTYSILAVLVYVFAVLYFCLSLSKDYNIEKNRSDEAFRTLSSKVRNAATSGTDQEAIENSLRLILKNFYETTSNTAELTLSSYNRYVFACPDHDVKNSRYVKEFEYRLITKFANYKLVAKMNLLEPASIYYYGKTSFLIVLIVTIITLIMIIYVSQEKKPVSTATEEISEDNSEETTEDAEAETTEDTEPTENIENKTESKEEESPSTEIQDNNEEPEQNIDFEEILSKSIRESIADEKEFALIIMKIIGITKGTEDWKAVVKIVTDAFDCENKIFAYKENCLAILKDKTTLDENLITSENTITSIENTFKESQPVCYIGFSNRNYRIITAGRLLFESEAALEHAEESEEKVIAFRANTQAYNEFMNQKN